jgi:Coenzyme PQQ synthesis protein D (PqqD)
MQRFMRSDSLVSRVIAGQTLIIPVRQGVGDLASIFSLNEVASSIWELLLVSRAKEEIVDTLNREFAGNPQQIERDVEAFLAEMQSAGLISTPGVAA